MSDDLKPCPFCGVVPLPVNTIGSYVFCGECGADGPVHLTEAIAAWNTRADVKRIEQLERENAEMAAAISEAENEGLCSGGNLWRFWAKATREMSVKNQENRAKLAKAVEALRFLIEATTVPEANICITRALTDAQAVLAELEGKE
jgi:Lar family restriction alleviation protein